MPPYRASGLGGINGSGVYEPNTRPIIDIGSVINAASHAFSNTREGVLHRALLQQAAQREDQAHQLRVAEAASQGILPLDAARRMVESGGMIDDESPAAAAVAPPAGSEVPAAPPPVDSSLEGAPSAGQLVVPAQGTAPPLKAKKSKYTMVDLGNGFAQIPELSPYAQKTAMLEQRLREMEDAIHLRGAETRTTEGVKQTGRESLEDRKQTGRVALAGDRNDYSLEQIAARGRTAERTARIRASINNDPATMKPLQRAKLYETLAKNYVGGADGDPSEAIQAAKNDPHLKEFGVTPDELSGYIGTAAMAVRDARAKGDAATAAKLLSSYVQTEPGKAVQEAADIRTAAKGKNAPADPTAGLSDADAWEYWRGQGLAPDKATEKVKGRKK